MAEELSGLERILIVRSEELSRMHEDLRLMFAEKKKPKRIVNFFRNELKPVFLECASLRDRIIQNPAYKVETKSGALDKFKSKAVQCYNDALTMSNEAEELLEVEAAKERALAEVRPVVVERTTTLPKFTGDPLNFTSWWNQVDHLIKKDLDKFELCRLVKNSLEGRAARLVRHYDVTADNATLVTDKLYSVFGEEFSRTAELTGGILDMKMIAEEDGVDKLRDASELLHATYLQFKALPNPIDIDEQAYVWTPIILRKLSMDIRTELFEKCSDARPKPSKIINFLQNKAVATERASTSASTAAAIAVNEKKKKDEKKNSGGTAAALSTATTTTDKMKNNKKKSQQQQQPQQQQSQQQQQQQQQQKPQQQKEMKKKTLNEDCAFCGKNDHWSRKCTELMHMTIDMRWAAVNGKRCPRCLRDLHKQGETCPVSAACYRCGGAHAACLCKTPYSASKN